MPNPFNSFDRSTISSAILSDGHRMPTITDRKRKTFATCDPDEFGSQSARGPPLISNSTYIKRIGKLAEDSHESQPNIKTPRESNNNFNERQSGSIETLQVST